MAEEPEFITIPQAEYDALLAVQEECRRARYLGVEEFRLWAKVRHPEVETVQDALRACSLDDLEDGLYEVLGYPYYAVVQLELMDELLRRLRARAKTQAKALAEADNGGTVALDG